MSARMTDHANMQGSNSAPNFQRCVGGEKVDMRCSSESSMSQFGQGLVRSAAPWTPGGTTPKSSPIAVVRPHELPRKNRHWSVVSPVSRGSHRQQQFEPHGADSSPHSHQGEGYVGGDPITSHSSLHSKHSFNYDLSDHKPGGSLHTGNIPYDGQFAPSPPLPPVRDSSSLKYTRIGQTHEKYPSWPVTAANQERDDTSSVCSNSRTKSWSEPTTTTSSGEFPMKPNKMVYQPRLRHIEEKVTSDSLRRHLEENGVKSQKQLVTGEVLEAVAAHMTSENRLKNFEMERSYPRYDHEGVLRDSKNYTVPSPPERDITVFTANSCQPHHQWGRDTHPSASSWDSGCHPDYDANVHPTYEAGRGMTLTDTSPTRTVGTSLRSSTDTFIQVAPLTSPSSLPPEILGSRNVSVKYVVRTSKPYYNTGTQTDDLDTVSGDVMSHDLKSQMTMETVKSASDVIPRKGVKDASMGVSLVGRVESFYDNAPMVGDRTRETHSLRDSGQQTVSEHLPLDVTARTTTLTAPLHYTAPSAIGATARNTSTTSHQMSSIGGTTRLSAHVTSDEGTSLPLSSPGGAFRNSAQTVTSSAGALTKDCDGTSLQWTQVAPQSGAMQEFLPRHDDLLAQIHEHSPSQTQMLRKLSQEFYGTHSAFTFNQPRKMEPLPPSTTHEVAAPPSQSSTNPDATQTMRNPSGGVETERRNWERLQNMSLRKAYGTCDDNNHSASSEKFPKSMHGRSMSTSHMLKQKTSPPPQTSHKGQASLDSSSKITRRVKDFVGSLWGGSKSTTDTRKIAEEARRDWEQRDMPRKMGTPSKLKRTTSEQIRPMKEQSKERLRIKDMYSARNNKDSEGSYRKISDDPRLQSTKHSHYSSDLTETDLFTSDAQKRISDDCDVFADSNQEQHVSLRPGSTRSTASSGSIEDRHNNSDPQLKKFQQRAVLSFFEEKTGKRMSSSSIDSSGDTTTWQMAPPMNDEPRKETMKKSVSLPADVLQAFHRHGRSSSGSYHVLREAEKIFPDTSFGDDVMSPPLLDIPPGDPTVLSLSPVSSVSSPTAQEYSPPLHPWDKDPDSSTQSADYRNPALVAAQHRKSEADRKSTEYRDQLNGKSDQETHPKTTYEYSSSSSSNSSPIKSANELARKFTYNNMAVGESYPPEEGEESPPPTLPPRNYRQKHDASNRGESRHSLPPPPPGGDTVKSEVGGWDYNSTPKADSYANQVRQQAYRLSQSHSNLLGAGRHPSTKLSPDVKTGVSISRPVDKPPTAQEALVPQPRSHVEPRSHAESEPSVCQSGNYLDSFRLEMNITAAASYSSTSLCPSEGASGASPVPSSSGSVFIDENPLLSQPPGGCFDRPDARKMDTDERPAGTGNAHHSESFLFHSSSGGGQGQGRHDLGGGPGQARHEGQVRRNLGGEVISPHLASVSSAPVLTADVDQSLTIMASHTEPPWMSAHKVVNPSHRVRSMSPERGASTERGACPVSEGDVEMEERLSVHALLSNFEKKGSAVSGHHGNDATDSRSDAVLRSDASSRMTSSVENLSPIMHSKVSQIRETLLRKSTENLLQSEYQDSSLRISPGTSPQQQRESTGSQAMASTPHGHNSSSPTASVPQGHHSPSPLASVPHRHSPCSSPKPWHDANVSDIRAFVQTYKHRDSMDSLSDVTMANASFRSSVTTATTGSTNRVAMAISSPENSTASPRNTVTQKSNESLASSLGDGDGRSPNGRIMSVETLDDTNRQKSTLVPQHRRHKSQEEQECEKHAAVLVQQLSQLDKHLCDIILPSPELKMTTDYMTGIFDTSIDVTRRPSILMKNRPEVWRKSCDRDERGSQSHSPLSASSPYWSPPSVAQLQTKIREEGHNIDDLLKDVGDAETSLQDQKEELLGRIRKKLDILVEEKRLLDDEISENAQLGDELTAIVQEKVENKAEYAKYQLYVTELGKVMKLLLQLSGRLARANNAINTLAEGDSKQKGTLIQKRDELSEKHEDAKQLKEGIDRRSHQVATFLQRHLLVDEFTDYEHFIKMKCKLMIEQQEIDDKIKLGREQLSALQQSIAESNA